MRHPILIGACLCAVHLLAPSCTSTASTPTAVTMSYSAEPLAAGEHELEVHGMSCPKCVSNVDLQLKRLQGVDAAVVDMKRGVVTVTLSGGARPSARDLAEAVSDAGFTLRAIHRGAKAGTP